MEYNDYELVALAKEHHEDATNILYQKYDPLIKSNAVKLYKKLKGSSIELSDLIQEGMIALEEAILNYNEKDETIFYTFAKLCIERKMNSFATHLTRSKHRILNEAISYDALLDKGQDLLNYIYEEKDNPEVGILSKEQQQDLYSQILSNTSTFEREVLKLKVQGLNYKEIADILKKDPKTIDNALSRIKAKLKTFMGNQE